RGGGCWVVARSVRAFTGPLSGRACGNYGRLPCNGAIGVRQCRAAAAHRPGAVCARPQRIIFARIRVLPRAAREIAHAADTRTLRLEKSGKGSSRKPEPLLTITSRCPR